MDWYFKVLSQYFDFSGRARRTEYWMFSLISALIGIGLAIVDSTLGLPGAGEGSGPLNSLYSLAVFIPSLAVSVRRLHDIGRSGWWLLLALIPIIGWIVLLIFHCTDSDPGKNQYGPNPKVPDLYEEKKPTAYA